jgi:hypothetical protein
MSSSTPPERKFAEVVATTKTRVDLYLRIDGAEPWGSWQAPRPRPGDVMNLKTGLTEPGAVDDSVAAALERAYGANC